MTQPKKKVSKAVKALEKTFGIPLLPEKRASPLDMLIATILSQNTNDINSHRAYLNLRKIFPRWEEVQKAKSSSIVKAIRTGGMANQKAASIKKVLASLEHRFGTLKLDHLAKRTNDEIIEILCLLDGVGKKTASCVLLFSLGRDVFPVDTHVHRICNRLGLVTNCKTPEKTFDAMRELVPAGKAYSLHINFIRFGRKICRSANPLCGVCPLYDDCVFPDKAAHRKEMKSAMAESKVNFMLLDNV